MSDRDTLNTDESRRRVTEDPGGLDHYERWWRRHQPWLEQSGYKLRPRYIPRRELPWKNSKKSYSEFEEGQIPWFPYILDATRASDGAYVTLKRILPSRGVAEREINELLASISSIPDPRNHCATPLEILQVPDDDMEQVIAMPLLRPFNDPDFDSFGEVVTFFSQIFEGIQFMHEHHIAHRDCTELNIMMDASPMYPQSFHPVKINRSCDWKGKAKHYTRTRRPPKYYFIDFGLSQRYDPANGPPRELPMRGGDKSAPEHENYDTPCDPFPTDIYYLGNMIREVFIRKYLGFEFVERLVNDMVADDPAKRPDINEVVSRFKEIRSSLGTWKLRSRPIKRKEWYIVRAWRFWGHAYRTAGYIVARRPAIPDS
ncbi:hypothetical protein OF83DRAFT_717094 [Amylostereum chailletii]|nr:hypothetical protein OF83DRAFT_717094 [Amylostereum chailletii]